MDPKNPIEVGRALRDWVAGRFDTDVALAETPTAVDGGFDNRIYRLRFSGDLPAEYVRPVIARIQQTADRLDIAQREARIQSWCADRDYPAPRVLAVIPPGDDIQVPVQLIEWFPGTTMLACMLHRPWRASAYVRDLAELQARLHDLPTSGWPEHDRDDRTLAERRVAVVERLAADLDAGELARPLAWVKEHLVPRLVVDDLSVCHGDFHPLNILVDGEHSRVIDWTDAGLGDRHGDVARTALLFRVAAVASTNIVERHVLRRTGPWLATRYLEAYGRHLEIQPDRLLLWEPLHLLHGWAQVKAATAGLFDQSAPERVRSVRPELGDWLRSAFEQKVAAITGNSRRRLGG